MPSDRPYCTSWLHPFGSPRWHVRSDSSVFFCVPYHPTPTAFASLVVCDGDPHVLLHEATTNMTTSMRADSPSNRPATRRRGGARAAAAALVGSSGGPRARARRAAPVPSWKQWGRRRVSWRPSERRSRRWSKAQGRSNLRKGARRGAPRGRRPRMPRTTTSSALCDVTMKT